MKIRQLYKLEDVVKEVLEQDEMAREDDNYLIFKVVQKINPLMAGSTFAEVMFQAKSNKISFESITRIRRKVQQNHRELSKKKVLEARLEEEAEYQRYALHCGSKNE